MTLHKDFLKDKYQIFDITKMVWLELYARFKFIKEIKLSEMDLEDLKSKIIRDELGINEDYKNIFSFVDFGNVNKWFEKDVQDWNNKLLGDNERIDIDIKKLKAFSNIFSSQTRCYYGKDSGNNGSVSFDYVWRKIFGKNNFSSKNIQKIKHYIEDKNNNEQKLFKIDSEGKKFIEIRKCNFDVEISVDAIKKINKYDTFCLFSGDADFVYLNNFLKKRGKKIILIKGGYITKELRESVDLVINAQNIKKHIAQIKQKPNES